MRTLVDMLDDKAIEADKKSEVAFTNRDLRMYEYYEGQREAYRESIIAILNTQVGEA